LPLRDFFLLPLISLLTAAILLAGAELIAGRYFYEAHRDNCGIPDRLHGYRYAPNCVYYNKAAEGPMVKYEFNECGYRTLESCGPTRPNSIRIALLGASTAQGFKVAYEDSLATRAAAVLTRRCSRPVEIQNMGIAGYKLIDQYLRVEDALALRPAVVMLVISPYEMVDMVDPYWLNNRYHPERFDRLAKPKAPTENTQGIVARLSQALSNSRAMLAAQYFLFQDRARYVDLFLAHGDKADYLRLPFSSKWQKRFSDFDLLVGEMAIKIHAAGLPFVVVFTPQRIQAALLDPNSRPAAVDPEAIAQRIGAILQRHDVVFLDTMNGLSGVSMPETLFYPVDGHMTPTGHRLIGETLARELLKAQLAAFARCRAELSTAH